MKTVLVVDDDKEILKTLKMILEYAKFEVAFAENGPDALSRIGESVFDLVLLDIKMAGMDGLTALEKIKALQPELPVVMISGHGTPPKDPRS